MSTTASLPLVYVVDDDPGMCETMVDILGVNGIAAVGFASGAAALLGAPGARPGCAVVDHRLPDTTGLRLATDLKAEDPDLAVVMVTADASAESAIAAVGLVEDYLTKPVIPAALLRSVRSGLVRTELRRENRVLVARLTEMNSSLEATVLERTSELNEAHRRALADQAARVRLQSQANTARLENQMHQTQRLESLGQLSGGIAHDFNNLLSVILNYVDFVAEATSDYAVAADIEQIRGAAERGARLTKQLLIVGRRETVHLEVLDLNAIVADIHTLLARTIGEHIELTVRGSHDTPAIRADRGQIEQVLLNLAVNARDAMPGGGTLTVETRHIEVDEQYNSVHSRLAPGRFVELAVSDTGTGMSPEVASHVFEPFFTTKSKGDGTGLGLATVYGIVTETGGSVEVSSEEGVSTTIRALFPAVEEPVSPAHHRPPDGGGGRGETILLVEDEPALMEVTARRLRREGYLVLKAASGSDALGLAIDHQPDLVLTDAVMPNMSGQELATRLHALRPGLPVVFMSGYSHGVFVGRNGPEEGVVLIEKPFTKQTLLNSVRTALDENREHEPPRTPPHPGT